jgi:hypothetical protein
VWKLFDGFLDKYKELREVVDWIVKRRKKTSG